MERTMSSTCRRLPLSTRPRVAIEQHDRRRGGDRRHDVFGAAATAPRALSPYAESFGLSPFMLTVIFAAYVLSLLFALLTVGSLSDYIGRRPAIIAALSLNIVAMVMFMTADSAFALIAARSVQGFATGLATTTLGAAILDVDRGRGPVLNSLTAFCRFDRRQASARACW